MSAKDPVLYECRNKACTLGARTEPGRFTGGMTAQQRHLLTGEPEETLVEGGDYGEGVCPSCGEPGVEVGTHNTPTKGA